MEEKVMTLHPEGKSGVNISKAKYDLIKASIVEVLRTDGSVTFTELAERVSEKLDGTFDGSISWYVTTVKLDLEARKIVERVPKSKPQKLGLVKN